MAVYDLAGTCTLAELYRASCAVVEYANMTSLLNIPEIYHFLAKLIQEEAVQASCGQGLRLSPLPGTPGTTGNSGENCPSRGGKQ